VRLFFLSIFLMLFSACAHQPRDWENQFDAQQLNLWNQHFESLRAYPRWQAQGRFAARNGEDAWSGSLLWQQKDEHYLIRLSGPLGQGGMLLEGDEELATITLSRNRQYEARSANELVRQYAGLRLPLEELRHWLLGVPAPWGGYAITGLDQSGRIERLTQRGWDVQFSAYQSLENTSVPGKIRLQHPDYQVRLIIQSWQAGG